MKIQIASDLHREFLSPTNYQKLWYQIEPVGADVLILAGDIDNGTDSLNWMHAISKEYKKIFYVPGNHEYYGHDYVRVREEFKKFQKFDGKVTILDDGFYDFQGVRFLGSTYWTDMDRHHPDVVHKATWYMNDYRQIKHAGSPFKPFHALKANREGKEFFLKNYSKDMPVVSITHMAPSEKSIAEEFRKDIETNPYYVSDDDELLIEMGSVLHFHGHTHVNHDYRIENTRVICNPHGYDGYEPNTGFKRDLVVEL